MKVEATDNNAQLGNVDGSGGAGFSSLIMAIESMMAGIVV